MTKLFLVERKNTNLYCGRSRGVLLWTTFDNAFRFSKQTLGDAVIIMEKRRFRVGVLEAPTDGELFEKYRLLARGMAKYVVRGRRLLEYQEEAESRLALLIMTKWNSYDPRRAARSTWVGRMVAWQLLRHRDSEMRPERLSTKLPAPKSFREEVKWEVGKWGRRILRELRRDPAACMQAMKWARDSRKIESFLARELAADSEQIRVGLDQLKEVLYG